MAHFIIIDPTATNRVSIAHQVSQLNIGNCLQFKNFEDARKHFSQMAGTEGVIIASVYESVSSLLNFAQVVREDHPQLGVIATAESISFEDMRTLIGSGIDQILIKPFNANQLKDKIISAIRFRQQVLSEPPLSDKQKTFFQGEIEKVSEKLYKATLKGWITENCQLPEIQPDVRDATLFVDFTWIKGINSIGVRTWVLWLKSLQSKGFLTFEFENLRPAVLQQASLVQGFLPASANINSFYLFYWCEELGLEKEFRFTRGKDFGQDAMTIPKTRDETIKGKIYRFEISHSLERILKFYQGKIELT